VTDAHLVEVESQEREHVAVRYLCELPFLLNDLLVPMGLQPDLYWVLLQVPHGELVAGRSGDVDLMAGPLGVVSPGVFEWPPTLDHLVAIEVKCAHRIVQDATVRSQHSSPSNVQRLRSQLDKQWRFVPFNRVALLDVVINPPSGGTDGQAWLHAAVTAADSMDFMRQALAERLPIDSGFGHFAFSWGAVNGADERWRGAGAPMQLRQAHENPYLKKTEVQPLRRELESNVSRLLSKYPAPTFPPALLGQYSDSSKGSG
jgi:hypothetical protein